MKNKIPFIVLAIVIVGLFYLLIFVDSPPQKTSQDNTQSNNIKQNTSTSKIITADKIDIIHFYATQQCFSCITVGDYALKTIMERFPEEYEKGTITFHGINVDLPEHKEITMKYRARGSSLFINAIDDGQDNIMEDVTVWRLVSNQSQFMDYFEKKLSNFLIQ